MKRRPSYGVLFEIEYTAQHFVRMRMLKTQW